MERRHRHALLALQGATFVLGCGVLSGCPGFNPSPEPAPTPPVATPPMTCSGEPGTGQQFVLAVDLPNGCGDLYYTVAKSRAEAELCATRDGLHVAPNLCRYEVLMESTPVPIYQYPAASDDAHAVACVKNTQCGESCAPVVTRSCI